MPPSVSEPQSRMYALEKTENFRWVANIFAKPSPRTLTSLDLAPLDVQLKLADIGQFAEVAHGSVSPEFIWKNMERLLQPYFPLDGYDALRGSELVSAFRGTVAGLQGYIARRSNTLVLAFSGTSSVAQSIRNIDARLISYPGGGGRSVHAGFWKFYSGIRALALAGLEESLRKHEIHELVLTGHSLGAAMCYLLALELLEGNLAENTPPILSSTSVTLTLAVFGSPRVGNLALAQHWRSVSADRVKEYSVRAYNDGVPLIPPQSLGYSHFAQTPFYFFEGCLYQIPASESEFACFVVEQDATEQARKRFMEHPLGGHNYYNGRDMERLLRTMKLLGPSESGEANWEGYIETLRANRELCPP